jgi:hypothetical protein
MAGSDWGADPQVRYLRQVFAHIEETQGEFLHSINISPFDDRLRRWRDAALKLFEKMWMLSAGQGTSMDEEEISKMYLHCLAHFLRLNRVEVPQEILPASENVSRLIKEALK